MEMTKAVKFYEKVFYQQKKAVLAKGGDNSLIRPVSVFQEGLQGDRWDKFHIWHDG